MGGPRVAIRIAGFARTTHGFAFVVTENGPDRSIDWGGRRASSHGEFLRCMDTMLVRARPLFVACEVSRRKATSNRPEVFRKALKAACKKHGIMILDVRRPKMGSEGRPQTDYEVAKATVGRFTTLAGRLPKRRDIWEGPDDRIGVFLAAAAAVEGWNRFRTPTSTEVREGA